MNFHQIYFLLRNLINTGPVFSCLSYSRIDKRDPIQLLANCSKILQSSSNTAATKIITNKAICLKVRHFLSKKFLCFPSNLILDYPASPSFFILYSVTQYLLDFPNCTYRLSFLLILELQFYGCCHP